MTVNKYIKGNKYNNVSCISLYSSLLIFHIPYPIEYIQ